MKTKFSLGVAAWCLLLISGIASEQASSPSPAPVAPSMEPPSSSDKQRPTSARTETAKPAEPSAAGKVSPSLAASRAAEEAKRAHILPASGPFKMETPPPAPRAETKTPAPVAGYVWMPGHWAPVKGQWQWTPGEWGTPPTAASVWIEAKYDSKTKEWTAGYWQPDRPDSYEPEVQKEVTAPSPSR